MSVYHFHAKSNRGHQVLEVDGIATMDGEILTMEDYRCFKDVIRQKFSEFEDGYITITSLMKLQ